MLNSFITRDFDGVYYVDYFYSATMSMDFGEIVKYIEKLADIYKNSLLKENSKLDILISKRGWFRDKFNVFLKRLKSEEFFSYFEKNDEEKAIISNMPYL